MTPGPGIEPGTHWWKASALTTPPILLPLKKMCGFEELEPCHNKDLKSFISFGYCETWFQSGILSPRIQFIPLVDKVMFYFVNNIQATISAVWLAENMSINPKLVNSAISPVQKSGSETECKMVKLKMTDSSDKIEVGQTKWWTKIRRRWKLFTSILILRLHNKAKYKAQQKLPN